MNGDRRGFSLIELLIVIVIIAILMGILLPSFKQFDLWVKDGACQRNLKDMYQVLTGYASRYEGWLPAPVDGYYGQKFTSYDVGNLSQWSDERDPFSVLPHVQALLQLGGSADMFFCPFNSDYGQWDQWPMNSWGRRGHPDRGRQPALPREHAIHKRLDARRGRGRPCQPLRRVVQFLVQHALQRGAGDAHGVGGF